MDPNIQPPIEEIIAGLADSDQPLLNSRLVELSNLNSADLEFFKQLWADIENARRHQIVHRLVELAEGNLELNFDSIFKQCLKDQSDEVRREAIEGLWENEEASLISPLIHLLERDSSEKVQAAAATALSKFVMLAEDKKLRDCHVSEIQEALLAVISDKNRPVEIRRRALESAAPASLPQVKKAIMEAYQNHDTRLKISSFYAMGKNCDPAWLPVLLKEFNNADSEVRYEVAGACGELEEEAAVPYLINLINDPDVNVQMAAINALGKIGNAQAKECLEQCLNDSSEAISQAAEQALLELETEETPPSFHIGTN